MAIDNLSSSIKNIKKPVSIHKFKFGERTKIWVLVERLNHHCLNSDNFKDIKRPYSEKNILSGVSYLVTNNFCKDIHEALLCVEKELVEKDFIL